jgi:hypothetical protein
MHWITVTVLQEDVDNALRAAEAGHYETADCPIERALGRALAVPLENVGATYGLIEVRAWKDYERVLGVPTKKMVRAMERFDNTGKMTPLRFRIKLEPVE